MAQWMLLICEYRTRRLRLATHNDVSYKEERSGSANKLLIALAFVDPEQEL